VGAVWIAGPGSRICPRAGGLELAPIGFSTTLVEAIPEKSNYKNGVIYAVNKEELGDTDKRESGYTREDIASHVEILSGGSVPKGEIYIYLNKFEEGQRVKSLPTPDFPIVQSYVDICLTGCLQIEKGFPDAVGFAGDFIQTTQEWSKYWENDRVQPRRAPFTVPAASKIDKLLETHLPKLFAEIQLAPGRWYSIKRTFFVRSDRQCPSSPPDYQEETEEPMK
jgi:hypothetical protein